MPSEPKKEDLHHFLQDGRRAMLSKLDGLSEYDVRRPLTPTGTNLLGLVKHVAIAELAYFGHTFDRPSRDPLLWFDENAEPNADMWSTPEESRADIMALYRRAWAHADATVDALALDAVGHVPWWPEERREVTLHRVLVLLVAETHRHAGHADILRESIDGVVGLRWEGDNMTAGDAGWWESYRDRLERAARQAGQT